MPANNPEVRRQVLAILRDPLTCGRSSREIARFAGMHHSNVVRHRKRVAAEGPLYMRGEIEEAPLDSLRLDGVGHTRVKDDPGVVAAYADAIRRGDVLPPIGVVRDGADCWVWDGFRRVAACRAAGKVSVLAEVRRGDRRDAVRLSLSANEDGGRGRTRADRRAAVVLALSDEEWGRWGDMEVSRLCRASPKMVRSVRAATAETKADQATPEEPCPIDRAST